MTRSAKTKFDEVKKAITDPINNAKKTIEGIIDDIRNAFNSLKISIPRPHIPIPEFHFNPRNLLRGEPAFRVDWKATGGIATGASIVGVGEKGDEAIVPLSQKHRMRPFAEAIAGMMPANNGGNVYITNHFYNKNYIREEVDIEKVSNRMLEQQKRLNRAGGIQSFGTS